MNGYVCFYKNSRLEVYANTSYEAQQKAADQLNVKPKQRHMISVVLAEKNGQQVTHTPTF
jgi:hypothetical protein